MSLNSTENVGICQYPEQIMASWPWERPLEATALMGQNIVIRRSGNLIEVSVDGANPLQQLLRDVLEPRLTYTHQQYLRGPDRIDPVTGYHRGPFAYEECKLFRYDANGRLCCGVGFLPVITSLLKGAGCNFNLVLCDSERERPDCYDQDWDSVLRNFTFRPKQEECMLKIAASEFGVIKMPTGVGKAVMIAMGCCLYNKATIHVVTPGKDLVKKMVRRLTKHIPNVGQVGCGRKTLGRVTVFSADSLHLSDGDADILFADEIHELAAPTYSEALAKYQRSRNFGFSATPRGRMDGADAKLESLFGPIIFELSYPDAVANKLVVPIVVDWIDVRLDVNPCEGKKDTAKKRWGIWRNDERNKLIAAKALSYDKDDQVLILVETIEHLMFLRQYLPDFASCYSENGISAQDLAFYKRRKLMADNEEPITAKQREQLRTDFEEGKIKKAIATGVWSTGVDFEQLSVLIRADAMGSEIMDVQAPGRVSRICTDTEIDKTHGILVDCSDHFDSTFRRKAVGRYKTYESNGWTQHVPAKRKF